MKPTIESLEKELRKRVLRIHDLEKENDALNAENQKMREALKAIRAQLRELGTMVWSK